MKVCGEISKMDISYLVLLLAAVGSVGIGSRLNKLKILDEMGEEVESVSEIKWWHAIGFFVAASTALFCLYLFIDTLKYVFVFMVCISTTFSIGILIEEIVEAVNKGFFDEANKIKFKLPIFGECSLINIITTVAGFAIAMSWLFTKNWVLNNLIALCLGIIFL
jgi:hypothetical protein